MLVNLGPVHLFITLWWVAVLVAAGAFLWLRSRVTASRLQLLKIGLVILVVVAIGAPFRWIGAAWPWNNPPAMIEYEGSNFGQAISGPDPRAERCYSLDQLRKGERGGTRVLASAEALGGLFSGFGTPRIYFVDIEGQPWLLVSSRPGCYHVYPQWP